MTLSDKELRKAVENGLIEDYIDLETQLTPNGFDLTVKEVHEFRGSGQLDFSNAERVIPETEVLKPERRNEDDSYGWYDLKPGAYKIVTNEIVDLPDNIVGYAYPRSSLLRMGATIENGVWDSGFRGRSSFLLIVENSDGIELKENARVNHIVFQKKESSEDEYSGRYKA